MIDKIKHCNLSRRDQFAMAAMQGMRANPNLRGPVHELAEFSVKSADALIKELDKTVDVEIKGEEL